HGWHGEEKPTPPPGHQRFSLVTPHPRLCFYAQLEREDIASLDNPLRRAAIALPARPKQRTTVVYGAPNSVAKRVLILGVAGVCHHLARDRVDLIAAHAWLQCRGAGLDRLHDGGESALNCRRRPILAWLANIPHALDIRAVSLVLEA